MLKSCLQVRSVDRATCDQILAMPSLLNHITGTLDNIQSKKEDTESLLRTIKMPRNLGMISGVMPAAQYQSNKEEKDR